MVGTHSAFETIMRGLQNGAFLVWLLVLIAAAAAYRPSSQSLMRRVSAYVSPIHRVATALLICASLQAPITPAYGAGPPVANKPVLIYKSGKNPDPSASNSDSKTGTRKDTNFLRCMSNCKADCQKPGEGLAKIDCVQDCQDQCCTTYEQCSFKIKASSFFMLCFCLF